MFIKEIFNFCTIPVNVTRVNITINKRKNIKLPQPIVETKSSLDFASSFVDFSVLFIESSTVSKHLTSEEPKKN